MKIRANKMKEEELKKKKNDVESITSEPNATVTE